MESTRTQSVPMDAHALASLEGQHVLVTGAGGSIGRHLCLVLSGVVSKLTLVSISESGLYKVEKLLKDAKCEVDGLLADYGDSATMLRHLKGVNVVIHAGAHKHVPICERNPLAAILNNVGGTQRLLNACLASGVQKFVQISTDKAVEPSSIMGATKRVCELLCTRRDYREMKVMVVRFGNVLGTDGSVLPLWQEQIENGGPVTLTSSGCTRYFMSVDNAVTLILSVLHMGRPGIFTFDMGEPHNMGELAERLIKQANKDIEIREIGLRPGEKLHEELYHGGTLEPTAHKKVYKVIEHGERQPSHQYVPDMIEHARKGRVIEAVDILWKIINEAFKK